MVGGVGLLVVGSGVGDGSWWLVVLLVLLLVLLGLMSVQMVFNSWWCWLGW